MTRPCLALFAASLLISQVLAAPPGISGFEASAVGVRQGQQINLNWEVSGAETLTVFPQVGSVSGSSCEVSVVGTTVFTLTAANADGATSAQVKVYDLDQPTPFSDTFLTTVKRTISTGGVLEYTWDGTLLREIPLALPPPISSASLTLFDVAVSGDGRLYASAGIHTGNAHSQGLMVYQASTQSWTYNPVAGLYLGDGAGGDLTIAGSNAYFGAHRIDLASLAAVLVTDALVETNAAADGYLHGGASRVSPSTAIPYFDRLSGAKVGEFSLQGLVYPLGEGFAPDIRAIDVTADGDRYVGSFAGFLYRLRGQPAEIVDSLRIVLPGATFGTPCFDVQVAPDGRVLAGLRGSTQGASLLLADRALREPRYLHLSPTTSSTDTYAAFTTTGLTKPRPDYFRASDTSVLAGQAAELCWQVAGASTVTISGLGTNLPAEGSARLPLAASTTFTLTAANFWGETTQVVTVLASEKPRILSFTGTPNAVTLGQNTTLAWSVEGADRVWLSPSLGNQAADAGRLVLPVGQDLSYILTAENDAGRSRAEVRVSATPPATQPAILELIPMKAAWSWLHPTTNTDPVVSDIDFHSTWMMPSDYDGPAFRGPSSAILGYGGLDWEQSTTDILMPAAGSRYTAYFRRAFLLPHGAGPLTAETRIDDGAVFYVDGMERGRLNFTGPDTFRGMATTFSSEAGIIPVALGRLAPGLRWLGASVHNASNDSTDLAFDLRLTSLLPWDGLSLVPAGGRQVTFTGAPIGSTSQSGGSGDAGEPGWKVISGTGGGVIELEGRVFHVSAGAARLVTESVATRGTRDVVVSIDVRTFQNSAANGYETPDRIEAWVEGSRDGLIFSRVATVIPLRHGGREVVPPDDALAAWDGGLNGPWTRQATATGAISPEWTSLRVVVDAVNDEDSEHFLFDTVRISGLPLAEDEDGDDLPDAWEMANLYSLSGAPSEDADGDGFSNAEEWSAGTNPRVSASRLSIISFRLPGTDTPGALTWSSVLGRRYTVEFSTDLVQWQSLDEGVPAEGPATEWSIPAASAFHDGAWRVRVNP